MTKEELEKEAEEYLKKHNYTPGYIGYFASGYCKQAYVAGAIAHGIKWHDLRKNPEDLPKKVGNYIVCYLDDMVERNSFELSYVDYLEDGHWIDEDNHNIVYYDEGVIAWCEIPKFEDKEASE